jgi:hypothetical protein
MPAPTMGRQGIGGYGNSAGGYYGNSSGSAGNYQGGTQLSTSPSGHADDQKPGQDYVELILTASGVPNEAGTLTWPFAIRIDGTPSGDRLRRQTEALFRVAALQAQVGQVNPKLRPELTGAVGELRRHLQTTRERVLLSDATFDESEHFLDALTKAWSVMENAMTAPGGRYGQFRDAGEGQ